jgi:hypothetical protein
MEFFLWFKWTGNMDVDNIVVLNEIPGKGGTRLDLRSNYDLANPAKAPTVRWRSYRVKGMFLHPYDLKLFPFDSQRLPLIFGHKNKNENKLQLVVDRELISDRPLRDIYPLEWDYVGRADYSGSFNYYSTFGNPTYHRGDTQSDFVVYNCDVLIQRKVQPYFVTLFMPLILLLIISIIVLVIPVDQFAPRNSMVMTAFLAILVYHVAASRNLPQVGYLTKGDQLFGVADLFIFGLVIGVNVINRFAAAKATAWAKGLNNVFLFGFVPLSVLIYTYIVWGALRAR